MYNIFKRTADVILSFICLILLSPLFIPIIIILKFSSEGEVFYNQKRVGLNNSSFSIIKFATMLKNSEKMGSGTITLRDDFRVTKPGKILRKTKINELPQIYNILRGDISFVGPRPLVKEQFDIYSKRVKKYIYKNKPGLTGIGSIFFRDEESILSSSRIKNPKEFYKKVLTPYKGELELWYYKNKSLVVDIKIIVLTAWVVLVPNFNSINFFFKDLPNPPNNLSF